MESGELRRDGTASREALRDGTARKEDRRVGMARGEARLRHVTARGGRGGAGAARTRHVGDVRFQKCSKVFEVSEIVLKRFESLLGF